MPNTTMYRTRMLTSLLVGCVILLSAGCIVGVHHHHIDTVVDADDHRADVAGSVSGVDLGVVGDFRFVRIGMPFRGQRHRLEVDVDGSGRFGVDNVFELRSLQVDVPLFSFYDFSQEPSGQRYPGLMPERHSLELWLTGSVGISPLNSGSAAVGLTYYRYGAVAVRLYAGGSLTAYSGIDGIGQEMAGGQRRREGFAPGVIVGVETTLPAGEYALELVEFFLDWERDTRTGWD